MQARIYVGDLCNWSAVASRFDQGRSEPPFVFVLRESDGATYVELAVWSDDGHTFDIVAVEGSCRGGHEEMSRLRRSCWEDIIWEVDDASLLTTTHLSEFADWLEHLLPPKEPAVISISGPHSSVVQVVRGGLALSGSGLSKALSHVGQLRVSPSQYWALCFWANEFPEVSIRPRKFGSRKALACWAAE